MLPLSSQQTPRVLGGEGEALGMRWKQWHQKQGAPASESLPLKGGAGDGMGQDYRLSSLWWGSPIHVR